VPGHRSEADDEPGLRYTGAVVLGLSADGIGLGLTIGWTSGLLAGSRSGRWPTDAAPRVAVLLAVPTAAASAGSSWSGPRRGWSRSCWSAACTPARRPDPGRAAGPARGAGAARRTHGGAGGSRPRPTPGSAPRWAGGTGDRHPRRLRHGDGARRRRVPGRRHTRTSARWSWRPTPSAHSEPPPG